ncbi:thiol reductant ABC exporter subunit CydC [Microlunatus sp. GCM10028923]|uniref:thiol reductant ABC exporter subunit CydC n=1 Tax=Microlunatus sp. GCM10028923 TaxID=3273400 RepID=UPI003621F9A3
MTTTSDTPTDRRPLLRLLPYMASRPLTFGLVILSGLIYYGAVAVLPALAAYQLGLLAGTGAVAPETGLVVALGLGVVVAAVGQWWQGSIGHDWAYRLLKELRIRIVDGIARATPGRLLGRRTGELADIAKNDVNATELFFAHTAADYIGAGLVSVATLVVAAVLNPPTALALAVPMLLVAVVPALLARRAGAQGRRLRAARGQVAAETADVVQGLRELALAGREHDFAARVQDRSREVTYERRRYVWRSGMELMITELILGLGLLLVTAVAASQVSSGALPLPWLPVMMVAATSALAPIATVSTTARSLGDVRAAAARVLAIIDYPAQVAEPDRPLMITDPVPPVEFDQVSFSYPSRTEPVLHNLSLRIAPGETVALIGRSGAGKSTCANLLLRFWDPSSGMIKIAGVDLRELSDVGLRRTVSLVPQDIFLYDDTIAANLRLGRPDATDDEVRDVARLTGAGGFIEALPEGYQTRVGESGSTLSGGQRQRLAIARALLTQAPVLILDEAVSSLDTDSERALHESLDATRGTRTTLVIAHRAATILRADRAVLLDAGRIVADGPPEEVLNAARHLEARTAP